MKVMTEAESHKTERFPDNRSLVLFFLQGAKRWFALAVVFSLLMSLLQLINPRIIRYCVDALLGQGSSSLSAFGERFMTRLGGTAYLQEHLEIMAGLIIAVALLASLCRYGFQVCNTRGAETLVKRMRDTLYDHILHLPYAWHNENQTGDIIQRCTSDVEQIKMFVSEQLTSLARVVILIIFTQVFMYRINVRLMLVSAAFLPVIILYSFFFHHRIGEQFLKADTEEGKLSSIAQENLTGVRIVRAFGRESYECDRFARQNEYYTSLWVRLMKLLSAFWSSGDFLSYAQILTVCVFGVRYTIAGTMSVGDYVAFVQYNAMLTWPVRMLGRVIANLSKAGISLDRLRYIMNAQPEADAENAVRPDFHQDIRFDHVRFTYDNGASEILKDVSFTIPAGSTVGILGGTGSGKSTLMSLLDRLYDLPPENGHIWIGDTDLQQIERTWVRQNIGMVLQEPYLFSRTLAENIRIARPDAGLAQIRTAARAAQLEETVEHFQKGYDTYVGERGVTLSGGQKQRTAIAQMLIREPAVMIFDDSLSAVDAETDAKIRASLSRHMQGHTVILISHRISTLMNADQILVLQNGRLVQQGTHAQLIRQPGIYRTCYELQIQQSELEGEVSQA